MPYQDKRKDRDWHREYMRRKRGVTESRGVTSEGCNNGVTGVNTLCRVPKLSKRLLGKGSRLGFEPVAAASEMDAAGEPMY